MQTRGGGEGSGNKNDPESHHPNTIIFNIMILFPRSKGTFLTQKINHRSQRLFWGCLQFLGTCFRCTGPQILICVWGDRWQPPRCELSPEESPWGPLLSSGAVVKSPSGRRGHVSPC